jgi:hypothetical protein
LHVFPMRDVWSNSSTSYSLRSKYLIFLCRQYFIVIFLSFIYS